MFGTKAAPEGITNPPIDELLGKVDSKYALVVFAAARARQINTYHRQLADGQFGAVGPLVDAKPEEKPLSVALREIDADQLSLREADSLGM